MNHCTVIYNLSRWIKHICCTFKLVSIMTCGSDRILAHHPSQSWSWLWGGKKICCLSVSFGTALFLVKLTFSVNQGQWQPDPKTLQTAHCCCTWWVWLCLCIIWTICFVNWLLGWSKKLGRKEEKNELVFYQ